MKLEISGDGMVREVEALNKAGSALLGDSAFDNRTSTETLDALIPLMQTEDADICVSFRTRTRCLCGMRGRTV